VSDPQHDPIVDSFVVEVEPGRVIKATLVGHCPDDEFDLVGQVIVPGRPGASASAHVALGVSVSLGVSSEPPLEFVQDPSNPSVFRAQA
jgi:hypothetical protein